MRIRPAIRNYRRAPHPLSAADVQALKVREAARPLSTAEVESRFVYIPENDYRVKVGYYDHTELARLLRKVRHSPATVHFVADMLE